MDTSLLSSYWVEATAYAVALTASFIAALLLSSAIRTNKGAKVNSAWAAIAIGLILVGLSEGSKMTAHLGFPLFEDWDGLMMAVGVLCIFFGVIIWYRIVKKAVS